MSWRLARSLETLRSQVNALYPERSKGSDGTIGDAEHSSRTSDHNPDKDDVVCALDLTHDPRHGFDSYEFAELLRKKKDKRIKYVISNHRIFSSTEQPWKWRPYKGASPHTRHVHVSVNQKGRDDARPWNLDGLSDTVPEDLPPPAHEPLLRIGDSGVDVAELQKLLGVTADGDFGPKTLAAVKAFQTAHGLHSDGVVGPYTWEALRKGI